MSVRSRLPTSRSPRAAASEASMPGPWTHVANPCASCCAVVPPCCCCLDTLVCFDKGCLWCISNVLCFPLCTISTAAAVAESGDFWCCCGFLSAAQLLGALTTPALAGLATCGALLTLRRRLVAKYYIAESCPASACRVFCCQLCSVAQLMMEVEAREEGDSFGFSIWQPLDSSDERGRIFRWGTWQPHMGAAVEAEIIGEDERSDARDKLLLRPEAEQQIAMV